eukprot:TRINITY_DN840_c0_g1_i3.p1 TRINITY_DN840_c0_g1~~TRINITY_DN840_c0_g1_i3.p1  ORF type:complete len:252 (+),score=52.20 TRINITY_DN840_c0_g1_i3:263-1018(+)
MGFTRKKVNTRPREKEFTAEKRRRYERYQQSIKTDPILSIDRVICVDETGVNDITAERSYGWSKAGEECRVTRRYIKGPNRSLLAAISIDGYVHHTRKKGGYKTVDFNAFMKQLMNKLARRRDGKSYTFVMDNASIHKSKALKDMIAERGHNLVLIPPYSPEFNPIEEAFSAFKASLRRNYHLADQCTFEAMDYCIKEAITARKCQGWYRHSGYQVIADTNPNTNGQPVTIRLSNRGRRIRTRNDPMFEFF